MKGKLVSWTDKLKESLGLLSISAKMVDLENGSIDEYKYRNGRLHNRRYSSYQTVPGFQECYLLYDRENVPTTILFKWNSATHRCVTIDRNSVMYFLNYWKESGFYKVTVNGKEL